MNDIILIVTRCQQSMSKKFHYVNPVTRPKTGEHYLIDTITHKPKIVCDVDLMGLIYSDTSPDNFLCGTVEFENGLTVYLTKSYDSGPPYKSIFLIRVVAGTPYERTENINIIRVRRFDVVKYYSVQDKHKIPDLNNPSFNRHTELLCAARRRYSEFPFDEVDPITIEFLANVIAISLKEWRSPMFDKLIRVYNVTHPDTLITVLKLLRLVSFVKQKSNLDVLRALFSDVEELWDERRLMEAILVSFQLRYMDSVMMLLDIIVKYNVNNVDNAQTIQTHEDDRTERYMHSSFHLQAMAIYLRLINKKYGVNIRYDTHESHDMIVNMYKFAKRIHVRDIFANFFVQLCKNGLLPSIKKEILMFL